MESRSKIFVCLNNGGFTLMELFIVVAIMSLLSAAALLSLTDSRKKAFDTMALRDAMSLITVVHNNIFEDLDIDYTHNAGDGSRIGTKEIGGTLRDPVFILSPGVQAVLSGFSSRDEISNVDIYVFHNGGTMVGEMLLPGITAKKVFAVNIDEETGDVTTSFVGGP